mmetsp:Transcript_15167/g.34560  ORF Transcript_15167/g.34560 Transcript_15167/m.34560 type:complete len:357 (+) Transcript_15167:67-1137(+)
MEGANPETQLVRPAAGDETNKMAESPSETPAELDLKELATMLLESQQDMLQVQKEIEAEMQAQKRSLAARQLEVDRLLEDFTQRFGTVLAQLEAWPAKQASLSASIQGLETRLHDIGADLAPLADTTGLMEQVQSLAGDKSLVAEDLVSLHGQQTQLTTQQQDISEKMRALRSDVHLDGDLTTRFQSEISILRTDVMDVASVVNLLHDRVDELSEGPGDGVVEATAELCSLANAAAGLSSRLDWLATTQQEEVHTALKPQEAPVIAAVPARVAPLHTTHVQPMEMRRSPQGGHVATVVRGIDTSQSSSGRSSRPEIGPIGTAPRYRAPSPRKWMAEPLAVTIARGVGEQSTSGRPE